MWTRATLLALCCASAAAAAEGPGIDWAPYPKAALLRCRALLSSTRARAPGTLRGADAASALAAFENLRADLDDALVAERVLADLSPDPSLRGAAATCTSEAQALSGQLDADPLLPEVARRALTEAKTQAERQLAKVYGERARDAGAELGEAARVELATLKRRLREEEQGFVAALSAASVRMPLAPEELASLPAEVLRLAVRGGPRAFLPVDDASAEVVLRNLRSGQLRRRYYALLHTRGGPPQVARLERAVRLRSQIARLLGQPSCAALRLSHTSARTPGKVHALVDALTGALLPRARAEAARLAGVVGTARLSAADELFARQRAEPEAGDAGAEDAFARGAVEPALLERFGALFGVRFRRIEGAPAWAPEVSLWALDDARSGERLAWLYLDVAPREGKFTRPATSNLRPARLRGGQRQLPIVAIVGNGPRGTPGYYTHRGVLELAHELGHVLHSALSRAPWAALASENGRADFVETPSQLLEFWANDPEFLRSVSRRGGTGAPMSLADARRSVAREHRASGQALFWTRQAFLADYDLVLNETPQEPTRLWFRLARERLALEPVPGTLPEASYLFEMGGYDATYSGYLFSRAFARALFEPFRRAGLSDAELFARYRRTVLEPGASEEPETLMERFLGKRVAPEELARGLAGSLAP